MGNLFSRPRFLKCCRRKVPEIRKSVSINNREQEKIIKELRKTQTKQQPKPLNNLKGGNKKIVPGTAEQLAESKQRDDNGDLNTMSDLYNHRAEEEGVLKLALTHPTILKFLRSFMVAQGADNILDFYLDAAEVRALVFEDWRAKG
jgi:predicted Fe-S protein YdhL (DUF1289 family)